MAALPPFVIIHGVHKTPQGKPIYLGLNGWTPLRKQALSFETDGQAGAWIAEELAARPKLMEGAYPTVAKLKTEPQELTPGTGQLADYDPHTHEAG